MHGENHDFAASTLRALAPDLAPELVLDRAPDLDSDLARRGDRPAQGHPDEVTATLSIEVLARLCAGHFPGAPVVPGAHLLGCLLDLARLVDADAVVVERCVFRSQVVPDAPVTIAARPGAGGRVLAEVRVPGVERPAAVATFVHA